MKHNRFSPFGSFYQFGVLVWLTAVLVACGGTQSDVQPVQVEVTRVTSETVAMATSAPSDGYYSVGSESASSDAPPPPTTGEKTSADTSVADTSVAAGAGVAAEAPRSDESTAPLPLPTASSLDAVAAPEVSEESSAATSLTLDQASRLTAGEVDDNAEWDDYVTYLHNYRGAAVYEVDISERHQIWVKDTQGNPVLGAVLTISTNGQTVATLRTHSNGLAYFFPRAYKVGGQEFLVSVDVNGRTESFTIPAGTSQREWIVTNSGADQAQATNQLDILFLIDATGSMADEINQLKENIRAVSAQISALPAQPNVRFGMVTYRDHGDEYVAQVYDFTPNVEEFANSLQGVYAAGGGDYPEDLNEALSEALHQPEWRVDGTVSLVFLVADAPPHMDYGQQNHYGVEILTAVERGIKIYPIASSGLDSQGEYVFRQLAQFTGGKFLFLTYGAGGAGTQGTETDMQVTDYSVTSLDGLVVKIVQEELAYLVHGQQ